MNTNIVAIQMELTNACSCACAECPRERSMTRQVGMMDLDLAKLIIEDAMDYNYDMGFNLNGLGEPLLYKRMPEVLRHIDECGGPRVDFFTSLKAPESIVDRSFAALKAASFKTMLAITKHIYTVDGKQNLDIDQFNRNFHKAIELPPHVDKNIAVVANKWHDKAELEAFRNEYTQYLPFDKVHIIRNLNPWFNTVADMAHPDFGFTPPTLEKSVCDYPFILMHVAWDGTVLVCCHDDVRGELPMGKIEKKGDLKRIWESDEYVELRRKHNAYDIDMAPCISCERCAWSENYTGLRYKIA